MNIQWFPGHMTKTKRMIAESIKLCDCVIELCDARCPESSRNPELPRLIGNKKLLLVINKSDIADPVQTQKWLQRFKKDGISAVAVSCNDSKGTLKILDAVKELLKEKIERDKNRGYVNKPIRVMVCGIPNVGKSSFINKLYGKSAAKAGDRPGVTRGKQWITLKNGMELLDTPGILWPKFDDKQVAVKLAFTGAIKDDVMDIESLAEELGTYLKENYPERLKERYKLDTLDGYITELIARKRGMMISGGELDTERAAITLLDEYRGGKIGKITLERPAE